jgi:hypothetical protein
MKYILTLAILFNIHNTSNASDPFITICKKSDLLTAQALIMKAQDQYDIGSGTKENIKKMEVLFSKIENCTGDVITLCGESNLASAQKEFAKVGDAFNFGVATEEEYLLAKTSYMKTSLCFSKSPYCRGLSEHLDNLNNYYQKREEAGFVVNEGYVGVLNKKLELVSSCQ